ncbi:MAG: ABC-2 transporter permease, partial [Clostridia bacterium]|nr:ABC-2 transporter permease [Clostridia bacterium]
MKGALIKELYAFKASRMIALIIVYAVVILLSVLFPTPWFSLVLFVLAFVAPLTYASNDERYGWKGLVKALPVSTAKRVAARY